LGRERSEDDSALLKAHLSGDREAFGELIRRHQDRVYSVAYRMMGNEHDALDATQEAFTNAFKRCGSFTGASKFGTWMYRVAINTCLDLLRARERLPVAVDRLPEPTAEAHTDSVETRLDLAGALAMVPGEFREPMLLHDILGVPYEEISALTKAKPGTVKSRISRGRRKLAELLEHPRASEASKERT
jgi:RNA polymerase sigma-70 factor (ECF subfamily)